MSGEIFGAPDRFSQLIQVLQCILLSWLLGFGCFGAFGALWVLLSFVPLLPLDMILPQEGVLHPGLVVPIGFLLQWCLPILLTCHRFTFFVWESVFFGLASSVLGMLLSTLQFGLIFLGL